MNDFIVESLAGGAPRRGTGESKNTGAESLQAKNGGEGGDFFVH
jgi:hypothetical protein